MTKAKTKKRIHGKPLLINMALEDDGAWRMVDKNGQPLISSLADREYTDFVPGGTTVSKKVDSAWLLMQLRTYVEQMVRTAEKKNADYAGASSAPFANFSHVEGLGIATTEQGFLTRMTDKLCRVATFAKKGILQVSDESVEDTLLDLANYSLLMAAYVKAKKAGAL